MERARRSHLVADDQHDALQPRLHHEVVHLLLRLLALLAQDQAPHLVAAQPLATPHAPRLPPPELVAPVLHQRRRARHHRAGDQRRGPRRLRQRREDQTDGGERLAQPHLVRQDAAVPVEAAQPVDAVVQEQQTLLLVRLHLLVQRRVQDDGCRRVPAGVHERRLDDEGVRRLRVEARLRVSEGSRSHVGLRRGVLLHVQRQSLADGG